MTRKKMEGDEDQRRKEGRAARREGEAASEAGVTSGASKQRHHLRDEDHATKLETTRKGKQPGGTEQPPTPRPGVATRRGTSDDDRPPLQL